MGLGLGSYVDGGDQALGGRPLPRVPGAGPAGRDVHAVGGVRGGVPDHGRPRWSRIFHAMYATPISGPDVALGNLAWIAAPDAAHRRRSSRSSSCCSGRRRRRSSCSPSRSRVLTGLAFAAPIMAFCATQKTPEKFNAVFRFGITPLFLFSGTFFPVESLPAFAPAAGLDHAAVARRRRWPAGCRWGPSARAASLAARPPRDPARVRRRRDVLRRSGPVARGWCADDAPSR